MDSHYKIVIIGGGVAGLSAANRLADLGVKPLLVDAGSYPQQRICGEFLSHECLPVLDEWNIPVTFKVDACSFEKNGASFTFDLPNICGSISREVLENKLLSRAFEKGVEILQNVSVNSWSNGSISLSTGDVITSDTIILGTGKLSLQTPPLVYYGYKTHITGRRPTNRIEMVCIDGGYLGFNRVGESVTNVAILSTKPVNPEKLVPYPVKFPWLSGRVPEFGIREYPLRHNVFRVGDAIGSIPPVSGDGLAMAITSGYMVAEYALKSVPASYESAWNRRYGKRIIWANRLHRYLLKSYFASSVMRMCSIFPGIPRGLYNLTREA